MREFIGECRAERQIVILDCCHSGAFAEHAKAATPPPAVTSETFAGGDAGLYVLAAADALQFAWDGAELRTGDEAVSGFSQFTSWLVEGLEKGEVAPDDEQITMDALYRYLVRRARGAGAPSSPQRFVQGGVGDVVISRNPFAGTARLDPGIMAALAAGEYLTRLGAVTELVLKMNEGHTAVARAARLVLQRHLLHERDFAVRSAITMALDQEARSDTAHAAAVEQGTGATRPQQQGSRGGEAARQVEEKKRRAEAAKQAQDENRQADAARQMEEEKQRVDAARRVEQEPRSAGASPLELTPHPIGKPPHVTALKLWLVPVTALVLISASAIITLYLTYPASGPVPILRDAPAGPASGPTSTISSGPQTPSDGPVRPGTVVTGTLERVTKDRIVIRDQGKDWDFFVDSRTEVFFNTVRQTGLDAMQSLSGTRVTVQSYASFNAGLPIHAFRVYGSRPESGGPGKKP